MTAPTNQPRTNNPRVRRLALVGLFLVLACAVWMVRAALLRPRLLCRADSLPIVATLSGDDWIWLEDTADKGRRVVLCVGGRAEEIARAEAITELSASEQCAAWVSRKGATWTVWLRDRANGRSTELDKGNVQPVGLKVVNAQAYWLRSLPPRFGDIGPCPAVGPRIEVVTSVERSLRVVGAIEDEEPGSVVGVVPNAVIVRTKKSMAPRSITLYSVPGQGGRAVRIGADAGTGTASIGADGAVYWLGASLETSRSDQMNCVRRASVGGASSVLCDWVPPDGVVRAGGDGVYVVAGQWPARLWRIAPGRRQPAEVAVPAGYALLGWADGRALLRRDEIRKGPMALYSGVMR